MLSCVYYYYIEPNSYINICCNFNLKNNRFTILFRFFGFIAPKTLNFLAFQFYDFERT